MSRPDFIKWATSKGGVYLWDKKKPTLATWQPYQVDILRYLFPAGDERLPFSRICWSETKKSGKSLLGAALHLYFALFVDVPSENYVLSNDLEGSADRVFKAVVGSLQRATDVPGSGIGEKDWKQVGTQIVLSNGSTIKALPADAKGDAGGNQSFVSIDEVWGFSRPAAVALLTEFSPVPTRENSTIFYTGYQGYQNQDDLWWHQIIDTTKANGTPVPELAHIDDGDGKPSCYANGRTFLFFSHKTRQPWHTEAYLQDQRNSQPLNEYLRVWENRRTSNEMAFCTEEAWDKLYSPECRALHLDDKRQIVLAVDAAWRNDTAAIVGTTWDEATKKVIVVYCRIWSPQEGVIKLTETIGPEVVELFSKYRVVTVTYDPTQLVALGEMWTRARIKTEEFQQGPRRLESDQHLYQLIQGGNLVHYGDPVLKSHVTNAVSKSSERGQRIVKEMSRKKIDACVALSMSALVCVETLATSRGSDMKTNPNPFYAGKKKEKFTW